MDTDDVLIAVFETAVVLECLDRTYFRKKQVNIGTKNFIATVILHHLVSSAHALPVVEVSCPPRNRCDDEASLFEERRAHERLSKRRQLKAVNGQREPEEKKQERARVTDVHQSTDQKENVERGTAENEAVRSVEAPPSQKIGSSSEHPIKTKLEVKPVAPNSKKKRKKGSSNVNTVLRVADSAEDHVTAASRDASTTDDAVTLPAKILRREETAESVVPEPETFRTVESDETPAHDVTSDDPSVIKAVHFETKDASGVVQDVMLRSPPGLTREEVTTVGESNEVITDKCSPVVDSRDLIEFSPEPDNAILETSEEKENSVPNTVEPSTAVVETKARKRKGRKTSRSPRRREKKQKTQQLDEERIFEEPLTSLFYDVDECVVGVKPGAVAKWRRPRRKIERIPTVEEAYGLKRGETPMDTTSSDISHVSTYRISSVQNFAFISTSG